MRYRPPALHRKQTLSHSLGLCRPAGETTQHTCPCCAAAALLRGTRKHLRHRHKQRPGLSHTIMARSHRPRLRRLMMSMLMCCPILLLRHQGGKVLAQENGGGDYDNDDGIASTLPPTGSPSSGDASSEYLDCPGYASHIKDG